MQIYSLCVVTAGSPFIFIQMTKDCSIVQLLENKVKQNILQLIFCM